MSRPTQLLLPTMALVAFEQLLNRALALDPATMTRLAPLEGRVVAIHMTSPAVTLHMRVVKHGFQVMGNYHGEADTTISGSLLALMRMLQGRSGEAVLRQEVKIDGDIELGTRLQSILQQLAIDWEEQLSRLTGDVVAHQIGRGVREIQEWSARTWRHLGSDSADWLREEQGFLPQRWEVEEFLHEVDQLRDDVARLTQRVKFIKQRLGG
jgi:ubiquinone biosynthesis accessory factor UbiJ